MRQIHPGDVEVELAQEVRFCTAPDGVRIAYAVTGSGPPLVKAANWLNHLEFDLRSPVWRHWFAGLSATHRLIRYDERGCGLSDWDVPEFSLEHWVRDLETVVEATGVERFPLLGISQGGPVAITYALRHPERVSHLILYGAYARGWARRGLSEAELAREEAQITLTLQGWGQDTPAYRQLFTGLFVPDANEEELRWFNELQRISTSPENAVRFLRTFGEIDVSELLTRITIPTLVLHARNETRVPFQEGRWIASQIPDCRFVALESRNHVLLAHEPAWRHFLREVRGFLGVEDPVGDEATRKEGSSSIAMPREAQGKADPEESSGTGRGFLEHLKERKVVQWTMAYLAAAWLALQGLGLVEGPWGFTTGLVRGGQVLLALGVPLTVVLAWYHGETGRQKVSGPELVMIAVLLVIAGALLFLVTR